MMSAVRASAEGGSGARGLFGPRILIVILAVMLAPAFAAAPAAREASKGSPRLANLQIEIWPEFDRAGAALVILKGEIAADIPLPASVGLRIAASSGGPTAVASSAEPGGNLANLKYERKDAGDFIALKFEAPERVFHIEFYDPLATTGPGRDYTYAWTNDLPADRLRVIVQEPAAASDFSVQPALEAPALGQDGLNYRSADLGPFPAGKRLEVRIRYTKTDPRASAEILKPRSPDPLPVPAAGPSAGPGKLELAVWLVGSVVVLGLCVWAAMMWWYGRQDRRPKFLPDPAGRCSKCKAPSASGDRFCSKCGARLA
jgi:hypothetical protein